MNVLNIHFFDSEFVSPCSRGKEQEEADLSKAEGMYEKAVSLMPNDVDVLYQHALFLKERRLDYDGAEGLFQRSRPQVA